MFKKIIPICVFLFAIITAGSANAGFYGSGTYIAARALEDEYNSIISKFDESNLSVAREEFIYNGSDNFVVNDEPVKLLNNAGAEVLGLINYSGSRPSASDWARYAGAAAERYDGDGISDAPDGQIVNAWEIGNEENDKNISGSDYKSYLQAVYTAIKAANPSAKVITAATAGVDIDWLESLYAAGGLNYADAIGIHPYRIDNNPPEKTRYNIDDFTGHLLQAASFVRRHGGKDIWITEYGWNTSSSGVSENNQANYLMRSAIMAREIPEIKKIVNYEFRDTGDSDTAENKFGIIKRDFSKKSAFNAMETLATHLDGETYSERIYLPNSNNGMLDNFDGGVQDWSVDSSNADTAVGASSALSAYRGNHAFQFYYKFNTSGNDFLYFKKRIPVSGEPKGLGLWASGGNARNIWRLRITDATGEMFQGTVASSTPNGWNYFHWDFANSDITAHWGGNDDGIINYPITFEGVVYDDDPDSSTESGTAFFDDVTVNYGDADIYLYRFGNTYAAWKTSGSANVNIPISGTAATKYDRDNNSSLVGVSGGYANVNISESPIILKANTYNSSWQSQSANPTLNVGDSNQFEVIIKNTGNSTWTKDTVKLGTSNPLDRTPIFTRGGGWISNNRVEMVESSVAPNANATFRFNYTVPVGVSPGVHREYFRPVADGIGWLNDQGIYWDITIPNPYTATWVGQSTYPALARGESNQFEVRFRNDGTATWEKSSTRLGTANPLDRTPAFTRGAGWISNNRVEMVESSVAPGETGTFRFNYTVPMNLSPGTYREYVRPVIDGVAWLNDWGVYWDVTVFGDSNDYKSSWAGQSEYPTLSPGESATLHINYRNNGQGTWRQGVVNLGTANPLDRTPIFTRGNGWISNNRVELKEASVAPGEVGTFEFTYTVPEGTAPGSYHEYFRPVIDGLKWLEDYGVFLDITVL